MPFDGTFPMCVDSHVHSAYSYDAFDSPARLCQRALEKEIRVLTIVDHCDMRSHPNGFQHYFPIAETRFSEIEQLKTQMQGQLTLLDGIELGDVSNQPRLAREHLERFPYDFVLGSVHHASDSFRTDIRALQPAEILNLYFDEMEALLDFGEFDSLAHLDYPARIWQVPGHSFLLFQSRIEHVLQRLADMGKALEVNSSGLFDRMGRVGPEQWVLEAFRARGGRYITFGSDGHRSVHIGRGLDEARALALSAGFTHVTYYRARKPIEVLL